MLGVRRRAAFRRKVAQPFGKDLQPRVARLSFGKTPFECRALTSISRSLVLIDDIPVLYRNNKKS
jgi:hypothetical protein